MSARMAAWRSGGTLRAEAVLLLVDRLAESFLDVHAPGRSTTRNLVSFLPGDCCAHRWKLLGGAVALVRAAIITYAPWG